MSYRRCETPIPQLIKMIETEIEELENIQKELENDAITVQDIDNRFDLMLRSILFMSH